MPSTSIDLRHQRHARGCLQIQQVALVVRVFHDVVVRFAGFEVACHGGQPHGGVAKRVEIERLKPVRNFVEHEIAPDGAASEREVAHRQIARIAAVLRVEVTRAAELARYVVVAVQRACAGAYDVFAPQAVVHEVVQHAGGELAAHGPAFQNQVDVQDGGALVGGRALRGGACVIRLLHGVLFS